MSPEELLEEAAKNGVSSLALTDINYSGACQEFVRLAPKYNINPVVGVDFRNGNKPLYVCLAKNNEGFRIINEFLSFHLHNKKSFPNRPGHLEHVEIIYPYASYDGENLMENEWVAINQFDIHRALFSKNNIPEDKLLIQHTVSFRNKRDFNAHRLLRAIGKNALLSMLPKSEEGNEKDIMLNQNDYEKLYNRYESAIKNTQGLLESCEVNFLFKSDNDHKNKRHYTSSETDDYILIQQLCKEGLKYRYSEITPQITQRLKKELTTIKEQGFLSYFLINWKITQYARSQGYFHVGRGSGANSMVAYLLRITDVDPIALDLYFERFINLYRKNPPDFDVDFSWRDREDVTRFIFEEFGHVALLGAYNTFQQKAVMRELGKVFGLPKREIEKAQDYRVPFEKLDSLPQLVRNYGGLIHNKPSHLSIHAGGILISEKNINYYSATELPPKGFPTVQFDMVVAEDIGLYKFDILSQRGLGKIKDCVSIIKENKPKDENFDIHNIKKFISDPKVNDLLKNGKAIGCFYIESPAMRMLLKKLQVDHYLGLVAASSVIRPGVAQSGMMKEYILRYRNPERRKLAHPILQEIMPETFGVMVYQEDVIKVAHHFADLTLGEADVLRRGMSGKFRSREEFQAVKEKFFENCVKRGHSSKITSEIWLQIESFAGYAFAKGHSASYAVESYQSLYLKAYYPLEYMVAVLNNGGGFYQWELYIHEARMNGGIVEAPCINRSQAITTIKGNTIFLGFHALKELESKTAIAILDARNKSGVFPDLFNCINRTGISLDQIQILIRIGAFRTLGKSKKELLWNAHFLLNKNKVQQPLPELFQVAPKEFVLPPLHQEKYEDPFDEIELLGFPLSTPFALTKEPIQNHIPAKDFIKYKNKSIFTYGYLITIKYTRTSKGKRMYFGTFIDQNGDFIDSVHFPPVAARFPFRGKGIYKLRGKIVDDFDFLNLEVSAMERVHYIVDPRYKDDTKGK